MGFVRRRILMSLSLLNGTQNTKDARPVEDKVFDGFRSHTRNIILRLPKGTPTGSNEELYRRTINTMAFRLTRLAATAV